MLHAREITLRPIVPSDGDLLFAWRNSLSYRECFQGRRFIVGREEFDAEWKRECAGRHQQFMIEHGKEKTSAGLIYSFQYNATDGTVMFGIFVADSYQATGCAAIATVLFLKYLFGNFFVRKVSVDVFAYNLKSLLPSRALGFVEEGVFRKHRFLHGAFHDIYRLAMFADDAAKIHELHARITRHEPMRVRAINLASRRG